MFKRERVKCSSKSIVARLLRRDIPTVPADLRQSRRAKRISRYLPAVLAAISRPTRAELEADKYEGSVPVQQWLDRSSRK